MTQHQQKKLNGAMEAIVDAQNAFGEKHETQPRWALVAAEWIVQNVLDMEQSLDDDRESK